MYTVHMYMCMLLFMFYILVGRRTCPVVKTRENNSNEDKGQENSPLGCIGGT